MNKRRERGNLDISLQHVQTVKKVPVPIHQ